MAALPRFLAWRPVELAAGEEVNVEMGDGLAGIGSVVDHEAEAFGEIELFRDDAGREDQVAECDLIVGSRGLDARDDFFRNDQQVDRRLRLDVVDDDAVFVLVLDLGGDFAIDDFLEDGFGHGEGVNLELRNSGTEKSRKCGNVNMEFGD